ncbi:RidA family protein [Longitalea luteola]|uniref:RidA family protein n=1 Tax=Longitalea luteola TaxID=2812563 RepID=UPI001A96362F|nr:RidA family protein [Longitalea luteola]
MRNPFISTDADKAAIWEMLVTRDIDAFTKNDWSVIEDDFIEEGFIGIDGKLQPDPDNWKLSFPNLEAYKTEWLNQANAFQKTTWSADPKSMVLQATQLDLIEIHERTALAHKKFAGSLKKANGERVPMNWQTLYHCRKVQNKWKLSGFTGYIPYFIAHEPQKQNTMIRVPEHASQHTTAGPYSPVLIVQPGTMVVISGQAAIDTDGKVIGDTIDEQAAFTLDNCRKQLGFAGCDLNNVFKVNVYMKDLKDWPQFNEVYKRYFGWPQPVRTTIQCGLLDKLLIEIDMWAVKK